jgi:hypothetical protein
MDDYQFEGMRNPYPVTCRWCKYRMITYSGHKVLMNMNDALDYDWACMSCYQKIMAREL